MKKRIEKAVEYFSSGYNCSQSICAAYAPLWGMTEKEALKIATGFGAGMGILQHTCGAVTGAFMVIGLAHGKWKPEDNEAKEKTYALVREFANEFMKKHTSIQCLDILGCNISTPEGLNQAREANLFELKCKEFIRDAARILENILDIETYIKDPGA
jgi:C_GCAxxG_C_C family probable redox protein